MPAIAAPFTTEPLWTRARAMFARAVAAVGDAQAIARIAALTRTLRREIGRWLSPLEHIVRKLLLAEAAELHRAAVAAAARRVRVEHVPLRGMAQHCQGGGASPQARQSAVIAEKGAPHGSRSKCDPSQPERWRASFSFALPRNPRYVSNACAPRILDPWSEYPSAKPSAAPAAPTHHNASFRLARRLEALRRVLENPRPHAERLARLLAREAQRASQLVLRYVLSGPRTDAFDPEDSRLSTDAIGAAFDAPDAFKDSS